MGRWDRFHEARKQTAREWLSEGVVKVLLDDLRGWPPPVESWNDLGVYRRYEAVLAPECPRPSAGVFRAAFKLARWELEREFEKLDHFARNALQEDITADPREQLCLQFLHQWLTDSMLELLEVSRLRRPDLVTCLSQLEAQLVGPAREDG